LLAAVKLFGVLVACSEDSRSHNVGLIDSMMFRYCNTAATAAAPNIRHAMSVKSNLEK
jgi:hypothetical protein